ncbi:MAG: glycosyltransferase family 39 protein [Candidatus Blackburnbacteria bacterium]|nr:glycosyltransferase family 39 protein [Candidatus Blackburnbacteria bacterium]
MLSNKVVALFLSFLFFILGLATLSHYGINWDAPSHLIRGQAYLHYYLTGKKDYTDIDQWNLYREKEEEIRIKTAHDSVPRYRLYFQQVDTIFFNPDVPKDQVPRISIYQNTGKDLNDVVAHYDYGHPHISDVLSSVFNLVFFQKLGFLNDIDSYRVYGVLLSSLLVGLVFWWTANSYGKFSGLVAALSLSLYPLFWSESHFNNEKDIPQTVYWSFLLFSVWRGITTKSWKWILTSGVFFGLALGSKFNALFSIFVIVPWLTLYLASKRKRSFSVVAFLKRHTKSILALATAPVLGLTIFFGTWPYFWVDPVGKITKMINFYVTIGMADNVDHRFLGLLGVNTYPLQWILYTTPLVILFLFFVGVGVAVSRLFREDKMQSLLFLLWLTVPIARVTWPGTNIYGGVRQIMEFIPAIAIIAGVGGGQLCKWVGGGLGRWGIGVYGQTFGASLLILVLFVPLTLKLVEIHPNENVYFNPLIGGLRGAEERDFPSWGVSFGAPYREAIEWINKNAEPGAKLTLPEILSNIPGVFIRPDIDYDYKGDSGYLQQGEYVISLRFDGTENRSYFDMYLDRMIEPLYEIKVDDVAILKIWKNDKRYLKKEWKIESVLDKIKVVNKDSVILFDLGKEVKLSRLELEYVENSACSELSWAYLIVSKNGRDWERVPGVLPEEVRIKALGIQPSGGKFIEPFA